MPSVALLIIAAVCGVLFALFLLTILAFGRNDDTYP